MGFFEGLSKGLRGNRNSDKDILDMVNDEDDEILSKDYRNIGLSNESSNYGWYQCIKCGKSFRKGDMDIDHIVPKSKGGTNSRYNLQCICKHCNRSKRDDTSDTETDLIRRKKELDKRDEEDLAFMKYVRENYIKEGKK